MMKNKCIELAVNQIMENKTENGESTTYILTPLNEDMVSAKKWKVQITETPAKPNDLGELCIGDVYEFMVVKSNKQKKITDEEDEDAI